MATYFIGLMSGTSLDGVDAVLVRFDASDAALSLAHVHHPFEPALRRTLLALNSPADNELHTAALASNALAETYGRAVTELLAMANQPASAVCAIGAHGQTVRHRPQEFAGSGYTIQLLNGALLAELTGIDIVCDLRSRDVAAGGQGAPLVPAVHRALFARQDEAVAVLNIGGIANLTLLGAQRSPQAAVLGFDCGPGNALIDAWCEVHTGRAFDDRGQWAASGTVDTALLMRMLAEPYFAKSPPKSTGRDLFHRAWLDAALTGLPTRPSPQVVQATLAELTVLSVVQDLHRHAPQCQQLLVCGGGAFNDHLMARLAAQLPGVAVSNTSSAGVPPDQVEAIAFAWLAKAFVERQPGNLPAVTGARGARVLGALHSAR
jgi:anhydro-N-acetylmuramic acid kinase